MEIIQDAILSSYLKSGQQHPDEKILDPKYAFAIPKLRCPDDLQQRLINLAIKDGKLQGGAYKKDGRQFWTGLCVRSIQRSSLPQPMLAFENSRLEYYYRHYPNIEWEWTDHEAAEILKELIKPVSFMFKKLTRVKLFLQRPGERTPIHKDLSAGNSYNVQGPYTFQPAESLVKHLGDEKLSALDFPPDSNSHFEQGYYAFKIPLTQRPGDYGKQTVITNKPYFYVHNGHYYFLNENNWHGAETSDFYRGVIFVDGILDRQLITSLGQANLDLRKFEVPAPYKIAL